MQETEIPQCSDLLPRIEAFATAPRYGRSTGAYFFAALTGSLTFSTVANSMFQSSPFTLSTRRI
jgi:hypothetical protein